MFSLCIPAFAADPTDKYVVGHVFTQEEVDRFWNDHTAQPYVSPEHGGAGPGPAENYAFDAPKNGIYDAVECGISLNKGDTVGVTGTWYPANASVWIEFLKEDGSGEAVAVSLRSGQSADLPIGSTGTYSLRMMSSNYDVSGMLQIEW